MQIDLQQQGKYALPTKFHLRWVLKGVILYEFLFFSTSERITDA